VTDYDDLPLIQSRPGPTDAELKAHRDEKHFREVAEWLAAQRRSYECRVMPVYMGHIPAREVRG
jgi:hypothetical protein